MGNNLYRGSLVIKRMTVGSQLTARLISNVPLGQSVKGSVVSPNWGATAGVDIPRVRLEVRSNLSTQFIGSDKISDLKWFYNDNEIDFSSGDVGFSKSIGDGYHILSVRRNLVSSDRLNGNFLRATFTVNLDGQDVSMSARIDVEGRNGIESGYSVYILAGADGSFNAFNNERKEVVLRCRVTDSAGGQTLDAGGFSYQWFTFTSNDTDGVVDGRMIVGGATSSELRVSSADVELQETYGVDVSLGSRVIGTAFYTIRDNTDLAQIDFTTSPDVLSADTPMQVTVSAFKPTVVSGGIGRKKLDITSMGIALRHGNSFLYNLLNGASPNSNRFLANGSKGGNSRIDGGVGYFSVLYTAFDGLVGANELLCEVEVVVSD